MDIYGSYITPGICGVQVMIKTWMLFPQVSRKQLQLVLKNKIEQLSFKEDKMHILLRDFQLLRHHITLAVVQVHSTHIQTTQICFCFFFNI